MTDQEADRKQAIEALLAERKKFEAWLTQLEAKRSAASSHVFDRVFTDYSKRLEDVRARLLDEADTLKSIVGDLETRLGKEQDKVAKKTDERAEAELRAMVGEYSEKEWTTTKAKLDSSISDLRAKFDSTERELADLKELLASVTGAPAPARASVMIAAETTVTAALDDAEAAATVDEAKPSTVEAEPGPTPETEPVQAADLAKAALNEDALPLEESRAPEPPKVETKPTESKSAAKDSKPGAAPKPAEPPPRKSTPFDELAFLRSVAGTPSRPSGTAAVSATPPPVPTMPEPPLMADPEPEQASEPEAVAEPETPRTRTSSSAKVESDSPLGAPTPRTSQAIRSLKCQECGTLNFPTEWYCERCGGELAAF